MRTIGTMLVHPEFIRPILANEEVVTVPLPIVTEEKASSITFDNCHLYLIGKITEVGVRPHAGFTCIGLNLLRVIRSSREYTSTRTSILKVPVVTMGSIAQGVIECE